MPGLDLAAQQDQVAWQAVTAAGAHFKLVSAHQVHTPPAVASQSQPGAGNGFVEQLQAIALGEFAPAVHGDLACSDAIEPEPGRSGCGNDQEDFHGLKSRRGGWVGFIFLFRLIFMQREMIDAGGGVLSPGIFTM